MERMFNACKMEPTGDPWCRRTDVNNLRLATDILVISGGFCGVDLENIRHLLPWSGAPAQSRQDRHRCLWILDDEKSSRDWSLATAGVIVDASIDVECGRITTVQIECRHDMKRLKQTDQLVPRGT